MLVNKEGPSRWRWLLLGLALLLGIAVTAGAALAGPATGPADSQTARPILAAPLTTYMSTDVPKDIPDGGTVTSTLIITASGVITIPSINVVNVTISHTLPADLRVTLVSPLGTRVTLFSNSCGGDDWNNSNTHANFSDGAVYPLAYNCPPGNGTYKPSQPLSALNGQAVVGLWRLVVEDRAVEDDGRLLAWGLAIPGAAPEPTPTEIVVPPPPPHPSATPCPRAFSDVHAGDFFSTSVGYLACKGAISGYGDGTFRPYNNVTRGQAAKIIVAGLDVPAIANPSTASFTDVPTGTAFFTFVENAKLFGVINGYSDQTFRPGNPVTRGQLAKMVIRAAGFDLIHPATPRFIDVDAQNPFYAEIETAACYGLISGYGDNTYRWGNEATRGQLSKIVHRADTYPPPCAAVPTPLAGQR